MAQAVIAKVLSVVGEAYVRDSSGNLRRLKKGDVVGGLSDAQIKKLAADGIIQEVPEVKTAAPAKKTTGDEK